jgi:hypothetical protein
VLMVLSDQKAVGKNGEKMMMHTHLSLIDSTSEVRSKSRCATTGDQRAQLDDGIHRSRLARTSSNSATSVSSAGATPGENLPCPVAFFSLVEASE